MSSGKFSINSQRNFTRHNLNNVCIYEFEGFRLDAAHLMLYKNEHPVSLKPKVVETLVALIERRGEIISKHELMNRLWQDSFVEEANLSQNIYLLRKTLGNRTDGQPLIETFWRRGYRFNGEVRRSDDVELLFAKHTKTLVVTEEESTDDDDQVISEIGVPVNGNLISRNSAPLLPTKRLSVRPVVVALIAMAGASLILGTTLLLKFAYTNTPTKSGKSARRFSSVKLTPVTRDLNIVSAAISPDARYLAYNSVDNGRHSLWVRDVSNGSTSRIGAPMDQPYYDVKFSPDGSHIYYNMSQKGHPNRTTFRVPAAGGERIEIAFDTLGSITFSPDGRRIAFMRGQPNKSSLVLADVDGHHERELSVRTGPSWFETWGSDLSWSPDGTRIAVCGGHLVDGKYRYELTEISVGDGSEHVLPTRNWNYLDDVMWLADQSGLIIRARETQTSPWQIWHVSYPDGTTTRITNDLNDYDELSLSSDSGSLVTLVARENANIWTTDFENPRVAKQVTSGPTASDGAFGVEFTYDRKLIYTSPRDGHVDLWIADQEGSNQQQLTKAAGDLNGGALVTPDGRSIVFVSSRSGSLQIWRMDADGGNPARLTDANAAHSPQISPDGQWVYFTSTDDKGQMIAKVSVAGGEMATVKQSSSPVFTGPISADGALMAIGYYDERSAQPWKHGIMSLSTGEILHTFEGIQTVGGWTKDSKSLVVLPMVNRSNLWLQPIEGSEMHQLTSFGDGIIRSFAISHDFRQIAVSRGTPTAEAVLISDLLYRTN